MTNYIARLALGLLLFIGVCNMSYAAGAASTISSNFNGTPIPAGGTIWFSSDMKVTGVGNTKVIINVTNQSISLGGTTVPVPDSVVVFDPSVTVATTTFTAPNGPWTTSLPTRTLSGNVYLGGLAYGVPQGLQGGVNPVTWTGTFSSDTGGLTIQWQFAAAAYTSVYTNSQIMPKPVDDNQASAYQNSDHAGTPEGNGIKSTVTGGARGGGGSNWTGSLSPTVTVTPPVVTTPPDLAITKSLPTGKTCISAGDTLVYTLTGSTVNSVSVTGVLIKDTIPANTTFVSASDGGTFANGVVTFPTFALSGNSTVIRTVTLLAASTLPSSTTNFTNVVTITDDGTHGADSNAANNSFTLTTPVCSPPTPPDLAITKSLPTGKTCISAGDTLVYTLTGTTVNSVSVTGVLIKDTIPANTTFVSASDGGTFANGVVTFPTFALSGNSTVIRTVTLLAASTLPSSTTNFTNVVTITDDGTHGADSNLANNTFTLTTPVCGAGGGPDLCVVKSLEQDNCPCGGHVLVYTITAKTLNSVAVTGVSIKDTIPANTIFASASDGGTFANGIVTFPTFALNGNSTGIRTVTLRVAAPLPGNCTNFVNTVTITDDGSHGPDINLANNSFTLTTPIGAAPVYSSVSATPNPAAPGHPVSFTAAAADPQGGAINYYIDFGDGSNTFTSTGTATHTYTTAGVYSVQFFAQNPMGLITNTNLSLTIGTVTNQPPVITSLTASSSPATVNLPVTITATATDPQGKPLNYYLAFGDGSGTFTTTGSASHTYTTAGNYQIVGYCQNPTSAPVSRTITLVVNGANLTLPPSGPTTRVSGQFSQKSFNVGFGQSTGKNALKFQFQTPALKFNNALDLLAVVQGKTVLVYVGDTVIDNLTMSSDHGVGTGTISFDWRKGVVRYQVKGATPAAPVMALNGALNDRIAGAALNMPIYVSIDGVLYGGDATFMYKAKKDVAGIGK